MNENQLDVIDIMPSNGKAPKYLLLMLHGWGDSNRGIAPLTQVLNLPEFGYLVPNAPFPHPQIPGGRAWYQLESESAKGLETSQELLFNWIKSLEATTGVSLDRTIMAGFSQGGAMTLDVGLKFPLAGVCSLSGFLHYQPETSPTSFPPVLIVHGTQDPVVPVTAAQKARDKLTQIGVRVEYQELEMAHEVPPPAIEITQNFIIEALNKD